ncbi:venom acid phosphatase Acph-1-like [Rhynchophorus ferrugineus]|uniref:venom acid phosphatase Acph-1-like n=1 Tax=Rhynchophorus ferrugineus TaxID=354439 RepID=UPI003FCC4B84
MKLLVHVAILLGGYTVLVEAQSSTLQLVHVLFRHGDRNPDLSSLWSSNPYYNESFYREGYGQLTNAGKRTEYRLGQLLRLRYNSFLGTEWNINTLDVRSTDYNRTKMSAQLVSAGLWPPKQRDVWSPLLSWQPIPYNYYKTSEDKELSITSACSNVGKEFYGLLSEENIANYLDTRYGETFDILNKNTGLTGNIYNAANTYFGMLVQDQLGFRLPRWTEAIYPEPLHSAAVDIYYLLTNNTNLRQLTAGYFLRKILSDSASKIDGTLTPSSRKMFLYSAHENNIGTLLLSLEAYKITDIPPYGGHVLIELHKIRGVYGFRLFYGNYESFQPIPVKLPNCSYFCPYDDFLAQVAELIPEDSECGDPNTRFEDISVKLTH